MSQNKLWVVVPWALVGVVLAMLFMQRSSTSLPDANPLSPLVAPGSVNGHREGVVSDSANHPVMDLGQRTANFDQGRAAANLQMQPAEPELSAEFLTLESSPATLPAANEPSGLVLQELPKAVQHTTPDSNLANSNQPKLDLTKPETAPSTPELANGQLPNPGELKGQKRVVNQFVVDGSQRRTGQSVSTSSPSALGGFEPSAMATEAMASEMVRSSGGHWDREPADRSLGREVGQELPKAVMPDLAIQESGSPRSSTPLVVGLPPGIGHTAAQHIEYGKTLARRGAMFSARREFIEALRVIAASLDESSKTSFHSQQLNRAWNILREAESLDRARTDQLAKSVPVDLTQILSTHTTQVVAATEAANLNVEQLSGRYCLQAKQCLANAVGANAVSAEALHCLGKLFVLMADQPNNSSTYCRDQAMVLFSAALDCHPQHHHAANELGVLLASQGHLQAAKQRLWQSLQSQATGQAWMNLAEVHQRLGELNLATEARQRAETYGNAETATNNRLFHWVDPQTFDAGSEGEFAIAAPELDAPLPRVDQPVDAGNTSSKPAWLQKILR